MSLLTRAHLNVTCININVGGKLKGGRDQGFEKTSFFQVVKSEFCCNFHFKKTDDWWSFHHQDTKQPVRKQETYPSKTLYTRAVYMFFVALNPPSVTQPHVIIIDSLLWSQNPDW